MKVRTAHLDSDGPPDDAARTQSASAIVGSRQDELLDLRPRAHVVLEGALHAD
jgi:hypothetical protein